MTAPHIPFDAKASLLLLGACAFVFMLFIGQPVILPLVFATFTAVLLSPVVPLVSRHHIPGILPIALATLLAFLVTVALIHFITSQLRSFAEASPGYKDKMDGLLNQVVAWVSAQTNIRPEKLASWVDRAQSEVTKNIGALLNVIPLVGGLATVALSMMMALVSKDPPSYALLVLVVAGGALWGIPGCSCQFRSRQSPKSSVTASSL